MTPRTASRVLNGQGVLAIVAIVAITLLAYWRVIDGSAAMAAIMAITGVTSGTAALVSAKVRPELHRKYRGERGE